MIAASKDSPLAVQRRVIGALILRDVRTRFFGNALGYLVAIGWPLTHMAVLLILYALVGRAAPLGDSVVLFFAVGLVPVISYMYMSRWIAFSAQNNRPLLNFPIVKFVDILLARAILELLCCFCVAGMMAAILVLLGISVEPHDPVQAMAALLSTYLFGFGAGALSGIITFKVPGWTIVMILITITLYVTSGVVFIPDGMPEEIRHVIAWNPLLHSVEWMRESYYPEFTSTLLDKSYLLEVGGILVFVALLSERVFREYLSR